MGAYACAYVCEREREREREKERERVWGVVAVHCLKKQGAGGGDTTNTQVYGAGQIALGAVVVLFFVSRIVGKKEKKRTWSMSKWTGG